MMQQNDKYHKIHQIYSGLIDQLGLNKGSQNDSEIDLDLFGILCKLVMQSSQPADPQAAASPAIHDEHQFKLQNQFIMDGGIAHIKRAIEAAHTEHEYEIHHLCLRLIPFLVFNYASSLP